MYCKQRHRFERIEQSIKQKHGVYVIILSCLRCSKKIDVKYKYGEIATSGEVSLKIKSLIRAHLRKTYQKTYYHAHKEKRIAYWKDYYQSHKKQKINIVKTWGQANPENKRAIEIYNSALRKGIIKREERCEECGIIPDHTLHGHHIDYSKPLEVVNLCRSCHRLLHNAIKRLDKTGMKE